jgi:hypothetical protein
MRVNTKRLFPKNFLIKRMLSCVAEVARQTRKLPPDHFEIKIKKHKTGVKHLYTYYHCSKKSKVQKCFEPRIRGEELNRQLSALLTEYSMPKEWVAPLSAMLGKEEHDTKNSASEAVQELRGQVIDFSRNIARFTDVYVAQDIERDDYLERRRSIMSEKKSAKEQMARLEHTPSAWIEPTRKWIKDTSILDEIAKTNDLPSKKIGSNLTIQTREAGGNGLNHWVEIRSARQNLGEKSLSFILEPLGGIEPPTYALPWRCSAN